MDKQFMLFSKRKELAEEYEKWVNTPLEDGSKIKDCTLSVITFMQTKGYRKIPENAVVLTREEYNELCCSIGVSREEVYRVVDMVERETRKETAEKFAERLKEKLNEWLEDNEDLDGKINFGIAQIELIGVKSLDGEIIAESLIDEICKEITEGNK